MKKQDKISGASFFAGIGGFDLALEAAGISVDFQCEIEEFCINVLEDHWPLVKRIKDIRDLCVSEIPESQIWCGGFPCQDVSVARGWLGRDGLKGKNSGLFYPFAKLVEERRPKIVLLENVLGLLSSHDGKDFANILLTLSNLGYGIAWRTLNTRYFGAPQSRPRVFICAWHGSSLSAYRSLFEGGSSCLPEKPRLGFLRASKCSLTGAKVPEVAFCLAATSGRHTGTDWSRSYVSYDSAVRRLTPTECERIQGFPTNWTLLSEGSGARYKDVDSPRYKAIGNAVSVPVAQWVAERIVQELQSPSLELPRSDFFEDIARFGSDTPELSKRTAQKIDLSSACIQDASKVKWGTGGVLEKGVCLTGAVQQFPLYPKDSRLVELLDRYRPDDKYFLSPNAAKGILRRVNNQGRKLFDPLNVALQNLQTLS